MSRRAIGIYALFMALFGVFCYFAHRYDYFPGDLSVSLRIQDIDFAGIEPLMRFAPYVVGLALVVALLFRLWWRRLVFMAIAASAAGIASWLIKLAVARPRPGADLIEVMVGTQGSSFPSGHVALATVIGGFIFYLAPRLVRTPTISWLLRALLIVIIAAVGFSRLYLGAHWLSDIAGGLFLGGLLLYPTIVLYNRYRTE